MPPCPPSESTLDSRQYRVTTRVEEQDHKEQLEENEDQESSDHDSEDDASLKLMYDSGHTEEERRLLRKNQRLLNRELEAPDASGERLQKLRIRNNVLFQEVKFTREAVLDADNVQSFSHKVAKEVQKYIKVPRYDAFRLQQKLVQKCQSSSRGVTFFDWQMLGEESSLCFNTVPSHCTFLSGPLDDPTKRKVIRAARRRRQQEGVHSEDETPEEVGYECENDRQHMTEVERNLRVLRKTLKRRCKLVRDANTPRFEELKKERTDSAELKKYFKRHGCKVDAIRFLFNPRSFTQTVENLFHFSFLIKKGDAGISVREKPHKDFPFPPPGPVIQAGYRNETSRGNRSSAVVKPKQAIIKLSMSDFRRLCHAYDVEEGDLPHRTNNRGTSL